MKNEDLILAGSAAVAVYLIWLASGKKNPFSAIGRANLSSNFADYQQRMNALSLQPFSTWNAAEPYTGTWTSKGPLNPATYEGQIYD